MSMRCACLLLCGLVLTACGSKSPTSATAARKATISIASFSITGQWSPSLAGSGETLAGTVTSTRQATASNAGPGFRYAVTIGLKESSGIGATVSSVDLVLWGAAGSLGTVHFDSPLLSSYTGRLAAYGTASTKTLSITDDDQSHAAAVRIEAKFTFVDDSGVAGWATGAGDVPSIAAAAPAISLFVADQNPTDPTKDATLRWAVANATSASIDNGVGPVDAAGGAVTIAVPGSSATYTLTATNRWGSTSATAMVRISAADVEYKLYTRNARYGGVGMWEVSYIDESGQWFTVNYNHREFGLAYSFRQPAQAGQALGVSAFIDDTIFPGETVRAEIWRRGRLLAQGEMTADTQKSTRGLLKVTATF